MNRVESDALGEMLVPHLSYYGPQTARAVNNFQISGIAIGSYPVLIRSLGYIKKAAARANTKLGRLEEAKSAVIQQACEDLISDRLLGEFPIDVFQGGAGTSTNMNANEVIANRALELLQRPRGQYEFIHPNDHINLSQSTNDVYPTAIRVALIFSCGSLGKALTQLAQSFEAKATEFASVLKLGRTQLQDAVPMTLGQEFRAFSTTLNEDVLRLSETARHFHEVNLGGTAVGTRLNAGVEFQSLVIAELANLTMLPLVPSDDLIEASWDTGAFVLFSGMLKRTATKLSKISNDLRLLSSGPRGGLQEITLPAVQVGSSIMPGKINPVIPEVVNQVAFEVIGSDLTVTMAAEAGQLQLNAMEPVIVHNILRSIHLLTGAADVLREKCVDGIVANIEQCRVHLDASTAMATALVPFLGYEMSSAIAKEILMSRRTIQDVLAERFGPSHPLLTKISDPATIVA